MFDTFGEWTPGYFLRNWKALLRLGGLDAFRTLHKAACSFFSDSRLIQLFGRFATYNGSSPYLTPATFAIIPFVEWMFGGWYVKGGLYRIAEVMRTLAQRKGVEIRTGMEVKEIVVREGSVAGLRMEDETLFETGTVVMNADALSVYENLLKVPKALRSAKRLRKFPLSLSGFVLMLGVDKTYAALAQHNIFFSENYRKEFEEIFEKQVPPSDPTVYISVSSKNDASMAPPGCSNLFILINVPPQNAVYDWANNALGYRDKIIGLLETKGLKDLRKHIRFERIITPDDLEQKYRAFRGTIYGLASHDRWSSFRRPPNRSREVKGLYFAGGSTHPGGGIPLVLLSGKTVSELILGKRIPIHD